MKRYLLAMVACAGVGLGSQGARAQLSPVSSNQNRWAISWELVATDDKNCGPQHTMKREIEIVEGAAAKIRTSNDTGKWYDWMLLDALKPDGSGKVRARNERGRVATFEVEPGIGPPQVRFTAPYSICVWKAVPICTGPGRCLVFDGRLHETMPGRRQG